MSCCKKETKSKAAEASCCDSKAEETKRAENTNKSNCGCGSEESSGEKREDERTSCC